jgi:hypothetical protein
VYSWRARCQSVYFVASMCYAPRMTIPAWLQRRLANAFPSVFLQPVDAPEFKEEPIVVNHNHVTINFTGLSDDLPAFRAALLKAFEDANNGTRGDAS